MTSCNKLSQYSYDPKLDTQIPEKSKTVLSVKNLNGYLNHAIRPGVMKQAPFMF